MEAKRDFIVGLTALIGLAGLGAMLVMFGELPWLERARYELTLVLPNAKGARSNSLITLNGVAVGRVREMRTFEDPRLGVEMLLGIDRGVRVPRDVDVIIEQDFLDAPRLALSTVHVGEGDVSAGADDFFEPGDHFRREARGMLDQIAAVVDERFDALTGAASSFERLSETYVRVGESIERLVSPPEGSEGEPVNVPEMLARLDAAIEAARGWLEDDGLRGDARATMQGARETLAKLADAVDAWTDTAGALQRSADRMGSGFEEGLREFVRATSSLNEALTEIQIVAARVSEGEGTLGQLVNNPDLYRSLNDAAIRLETALREAQLLIEKFRKEGVPVQF